MTSLLPAWLVQYTTRSIAIGQPLTQFDRREAVVTGMDEDSAERNLRQMFSEVVTVESISLYSTTGLP